MPRRAIGQWVLAIAVAGAALGIGSVDTLVLSAVVTMLAIAATLLWWQAEPLELGGRARLLLYVALGLTIFTGIQCLPLPATLVARVAPHNFDVWSRVLLPLHETLQGPIPLSLDPTASRIQLLRGVGYFLCYLAALQVVRQRDGMRFMERAIVSTGLLVAIIAVVNPIVSPEKVYGLFRPRTDVTIVASFLNINNLSAYLTIPLLLAVNSSLSAKPIVARPILLAIAAILFSTIVWFGSRGGMGAAIFGMLLVLLVTAASNRPRALTKLQLLAGIATVVGAIACVIAIAPHASHLVTKDTSKLGVAAEALSSMGRTYPLFGAGRGAFESTFPEFRQSGGGFVVYTHPENIVVQWVTEWGVPVALVALVLIGVALRPRGLRRRSHVVGAWCALIAIFVHDQVDFSAEIPGVMFALIVCGAMVVGGSSPIRRPSLTVSRMAFVASAAAIPLVALAMLRRPHELIRERQTLQRAALSTMSQREFRSELRDALVAHPAEPYFPYLGAVRATSRDTVLPWVGSCVERARLYPPVHLLFARWLRAHGKTAQARLEYRLSAEQDGIADTSVAPEIIAISTTFDDVIEAVPSGPSAVPLLEAIATSLADVRPATRVELDEEILRRAPTSLTARLRVARDAADDVASGESSPWCNSDREACVTSALSLAGGLQRIAPSSCDGYIVEARIRASTNDPQALDQLQRAVEVVSDRPRCLKSLATLAHQVHRDAVASEALRSLVRAPCATDDECIANLLFAGSLEDSRGNGHHALVFYEQAAEHDGAPDYVVDLFATRARALGRHDLALKAYIELARRHPSDPGHDAHVSDERGALAGAKRMTP